MPLPGISNANEFCSARYLESVLTSDIRKVRERWAEVTSPESRFKALRKPWQKLREAELWASRATPPSDCGCNSSCSSGRCPEALGYPWAPKADPLELTVASGQGTETWEQRISERVFGQEIPPRQLLARIEGLTRVASHLDALRG